MKPIKTYLNLFNKQIQTFKNDITQALKMPLKALEDDGIVTKQ